MATLSLMLADQTGVPIAELEYAKDISVSDKLNGSRSVSFTLNVEKELRAASLIAEYKSRIYAWLDDQIVAYTIITNTVDSFENGSHSIKIVSVDPLTAILGRRRLQAKRTFTDYNIGNVIKQLAADELAESNTFVTIPDAGLVGVERTLEFEKGKPVLEIFKEIADSANGVDYTVLPIDGSPASIGGNATMGHLWVWAERGEEKESVKYEYGTNTLNNIESAELESDASKVTTHQRVTGSNGNEYTTVNSSLVSELGTALHSEDSIDANSDAILTTFGDQLLSWRSRPRRVLSLTPAASADYLPSRNFDVGDSVQVFIEGGRWQGENAIHGYMRVYSWELSQDVSGRAVMNSLSLEYEGV